MNLQARFQFSIDRVFDAPRDLVWKAWTDEVHLLEWWSPKGFKTLSTKVDLKPGGMFHYGLEAPDGHKFWGRFIYREIVAPERLVFVLSFADEKGEIARHFLNPKWPAEILNTVTFTDKGAKTGVALRSYPINATAEEIAIFETGAPSMQQGFGGTFDQLADYLAASKN
jgi:uncharacterized protein YndB with AHSA1/START domain